jgi:hypothetical protein
MKEKQRKQGSLSLAAEAHLLAVPPHLERSKETELQSLRAGINASRH